MRLVARVLAGLALLVAVAIGGGYLYLLRSLPVTRGTIRVAGTSGTIEIVRDADAIPHILAATKLDALYGLGFVHAQDRLWQMEFQRRVGHGRLSEVLGSATLKEDRFLRTLGFGRVARSAWDRLPSDAREQIEAYVRGVNAFLATHTGSRLPPEFTILGITPEPWSGPDVLVWVKMMAWDLSSNYALELIRRDIAARVGVDRMWELFPPYPADGLNIIPGPGTPSSGSTSQAIASPNVARTGGRFSYTEAFARTLESPQPLLRRLLAGGGGATEGLGSNNWVVDGTLTASGKPLLANDPHLAAQAPSLWYLAHMTAGDFDVAGATLPGTPAVAIGRNRFIAWGETNMFADVQDLFRERLDATGRQAEFKGAMEPLQLVTETVKVKGEPDVRVDVRISRHGPLVSDAINANNGVAEGAAEAVEPLAFRWNALDDEDGTVVAFLRLADARNWNEFTDALRSFVVPSQNFVYADVDGHIGYYAPGLIPIRARGDGRFPAEGWTGEMEWTGWIPFEELPHSYDPPSHFIVSANNRPVGSDYRHWLSSEYHQPYRAQRVADLIQEKTRMTPDDFAAIQSDTYSLHAQTLLPMLLARAYPQEDADRAAVEILRRWDFNPRADSAAAAIFEAWFLQLAPELVGAELGPILTRGYERYFSFITRFVMNALQGKSSFCGPAETAGRPACDALVTSALHEGVAVLAARMNANMDRWRWATVHRAVFDHSVFGTVPVLSWFFNRTIPNQGDWSSVNVGAVAVTAPFEQHEIPGYRQILDLSPAGDNRFLASLGQSGHVFSAHYDDQLKRWHDVRHLPMRLTREQIQRGAIGTLRLVPQ